MRFLFTNILLVLVVAETSFTQEAKAVLIDRFDRVACSDLRGRTDLLMAELASDPEKIGYVVLSDSEGFLRANSRRLLFENHIKARGFDLKRIHFARRSGLPAYGVELWKVNDPNDLSFGHTTEWNYEVTKNTKPFIVYSDGFNESECLFPTGASVLKDFLIANPDSRANIVIRCNGRTCYREQKKWALEELTGTHRVSGSRVRFFYVPIRTMYFAREFWLLP